MSWCLRRCHTTPPLIMDVFFSTKSVEAIPLVFSMYVASSIEELHKKDQSQLFMVVGFNFYVHEEWSKRKLLNKLWESIHDRVTSNVFCSFKQF